MQNRVHRLMLKPLALLVAMLAGLAAGQEKPFYELRRHESVYVGPGREVPEPADVEEVRIGYFGPDDPDLAEVDLWRGATLAVEEANAEGGYRGKPFRLVVAWADDPWKAGAGNLARMVYDDRVWAVVGGIDGSTTHLAEQVVFKARLTLMSPVAADKSVNLANVPWMFSLLPGDHIIAPALVEELHRRIGSGRFVVLSADDHDANLFARELNKQFARRQIGPRFEIHFPRGAADTTEAVRRTLASEAAAAVVVADSHDSAAVVRQLREAGFAGTIFGGPAVGRSAFADAAGDAARGVVFPRVWEESDSGRAFAARFQMRFGHAPDYAAAHSYDATRMLIAAVREAGLNRARIRDAVRNISPWYGATGAIVWDPLGSNRRAVRMSEKQ